MDESNLSLNMSRLEIGDESNLDQHSVHDGHSDSHQQVSENCNLIVNYLPHDIDDLALKGLFVEFGEIVMTKVVTDRNTKKSLGYGFVKFAREDDARMAIQRLNGFTIDHKCLKVSVARPPSLEIRNCKLYVTNLPKDYSENDVIGLFQEFGEIIECRVLKDKNNRSNKGVAFVQFDNKTQANNALSLNGCQLDGSSRGLVVKYAEDQHKKREMTRLQNLTTHNVYRYMPPGVPMQYEMMGDPHRGMQRPQDKPDMSNAYYYPQSAPTHHHQQQQQQQMHHHQQQQQHMHAPPPPPPQPQAHHGLGGINAIYAGAGQQPLHHLQVPAVTVVGGSALMGSGLGSPVMGSVSPNHFLYQQQQLLQQQQLSGGPPSPLMGYSPGGLRSGGAGRGRKGPSYLEQIGPDPQLQYGNWYAPPAQQTPLAFLNSGGGSPLGLHASTQVQGLYSQPPQQQRQMHPSQHPAMDVGGGMGGLLGHGQSQRSPVMPLNVAMPTMPAMPQQRSPIGGGVQGMQGYSPQTYQTQSPMMPQHHVSPPQHLASPPQHQQAGMSPPQHHLQQQMYGQQGMGNASPMLHPSPYLAQSTGYPVEQARRAPPAQHMGPPSGAGSVTLNVSNLPTHADVAMLHELFAPHGRILSAQIDVDVTGAGHNGGMKGLAGGRVSVCTGRGQVQMAGLAQAENAAKSVSANSRGSEYPIQVTIAGGGGPYPQK